MALAQKLKQEQIRKLVPQWKKRLKLTNYRHRTTFVNGSDPKEKLNEGKNVVIAYVRINEDKKFINLVINKSAIRKMPMHIVEHCIIHELAHAFYQSVGNLFEEVIETIGFTKETKEKLWTKFQVLEHQKIYILIRLFKKLKYAA